MKSHLIVKDLGHLKPGFEVNVVVHAQAGTNVRANERKDEMKRHEDRRT